MRHQNAPDSYTFLRVICHLLFADSLLAATIQLSRCDQKNHPLYLVNAKHTNYQKALHILAQLLIPLKIITRTHRKRSTLFMSKTARAFFLPLLVYSSNRVYRLWCLFSRKSSWRTLLIVGMWKFFRLLSFVLDGWNKFSMVLNKIFFI